MTPYTDAPEPWRRLACAMLLGGALGAYAGDAEDAEWVNSDTARRLAELVDLPHWPPAPAQLASRAELSRRSRQGEPELSDSLHGLTVAVTRAHRRELARDGH